MNAGLSQLQPGRPRDWLEILRPFSWTASIIPVIFGGVLAYRHGAFNWSLFLPLLSGTILLQGATNIINEYYDLLTGIDTQSTDRPSKVLVEERITPGLALGVSKAIMLLFLVGALVYALLLQHWGILIFAVVAVLAGYFYTAPPLNYKYKGLGPPGVFLFFGILLTQAVYYTLTGGIAAEAVWLSLPVAFLVSAILHANDLRDVEIESQIRTITGMLGTKSGIRLYLFLILTPYVVAVLSLALGIISWWGLLVFLTLPLALRNARLVWENSDKLSTLTDIDVQTAKLHLSYGFLWIAAFLL